MSLTQVSVDTTVGGTEILPANGNRKTAVIKSLLTNTQTVFLKFDASTTALTAANGVPLAPGESMTLERNPSIAGDPCVYQIKGITSSGSATISAQEL